MNREKEIQDELEKYWGQMDRIEQTIRKVLKYYLIRKEMEEHEGKWSWLYGEWDYHQGELDKLKKQLPDISDILEEK